MRRSQKSEFRSQEWEVALPFSVYCRAHLGHRPAQLVRESELIFDWLVRNVNGKTLFVVAVASGSESS